jgi:type I restriction enzyme S subunit
VKNGWRVKKLGDVAELSGRIGWRGLTAKEYTKSGPLFLSVHSLNYGDYVDYRDAFHISHERYDESPEIMLREGDVLICKDGAGIGKLGIVGELPSKATINSSLLLIRSSGEILPKFLYRYLSSPYFQRIVNSRLNGATTPHLYQRDITEFPVILPPLPEQQRIVGILDEAFDGIATAKVNAEKNLQNARALFESHLQTVFSQRGATWVESRKPLADLCELIVDCEHKTAPTQEEGIPSIRTPNIGKGKLLLEGVYRVSENTYKEWTRRAVPRAGDLILAREAPAGNVAVIPDNLPLCLGQRTVLIRPRKEVFDSQFLAMLLLQPQMQRKLLAHSRGATVQHVNMKDIRALNVGTIPALTEQQSIVSLINHVSTENEKLISIYRRKLAVLDELKRSLLHRAFTGEL